MQRSKPPSCQHLFVLPFTHFSSRAILARFPSPAGGGGGSVVAHAALLLRGAPPSASFLLEESQMLLLVLPKLKKINYNKKPAQRRCMLPSVVAAFALGASRSRALPLHACALWGLAAAWWVLEDSQLSQPGLQLLISSLAC